MREYYHVFADGTKWKKIEKVDSSLPFYQLQGLTPGSHYRMRLSYNNSTFWEDDIDTEGTGKTSALPSFAFILSASPLGFLRLNTKPAWHRGCLAVPGVVCEVLSKTYVKRELLG